MSILVTVKNLTRIFDVSKPWLNRVTERLPKRLLTAVSDVSFEIEERSVYAIVGESGSGKSTIGKMVVGLLEPSEGSVTFSDADSRVQMIFQDPFASMNPRWRVRDIINEPVVASGGDATGVAERLLESVGLSADDAGKFPHQFSGGQRQRICIARALAGEPQIIVCDEPTSALDVSVQAQVLNLMSDLQQSLGLTYLFITHDLTVVQHMADRVGVLYLGRLMEEAPTADLFKNPLHPYTQMLLAAAPRMERATEKRDGEPEAFNLDASEIPDPISPPTGCAFHPRCPHAVARCSVERPAFRQVQGRRVACHLVE